MTKREKIILTLAIISLLYGGYFYVFKNKKKKSYIIPRINYERIKSSALSDINKNNLTPQDKIIYALIDKNMKDPFLYLTSRQTQRKEKKLSKKNVSFEYKGFVIVKNKRYAIINGREYGEGEPLKEEGFTLWSILKNKVIIKGPGKSNFIVVPFIDKIK